MEKSECTWIGNYFIHKATGKALCIFSREGIDESVEESNYRYLLTNGKIKKQADMLETDIREIVNQHCDREEEYTIETCWRIELTKAEKLTNLLLGNENEEN